jgi:hypothetical protein
MREERSGCQSGAVDPKRGNEAAIGGWQGEAECIGILA